MPMLSAAAHPSCMDYSEDLAARARTSPWQCIDCKTCYICEDSGDPVSDVRKHKSVPNFTLFFKTFAVVL